MHQLPQVRVGFINSEYSKVGLVVSFNNLRTPYDVATSHTQTVEEDPVRNNQDTHSYISFAALTAACNQGSQCPIFDSQYYQLANNKNKLQKTNDDNRYEAGKYK